MYLLTSHVLSSEHGSHSAMIGYTYIPTYARVYLLTSYLCFKFITWFTHSDDWVYLCTYLLLSVPTYLLMSYLCFEFVKWFTHSDDWVYLCTYARAYLLTSYLCFKFETRFTHSDDWVQVPTYLPINDPCFVIV